MTNKKTAIVVGGSSGIGCEVCSLLVTGGWNAVNISRTKCKINKVKNEIADVVSGSTLCDIISRVGEANGGIGALVYCAGYSMAAPIEYAKESDFRYLFDVNFFGALKAMQAAIPHMKAKGGRIVLVSSLGGELPILFDSFYSCSKAAMEMLAREAYLELKPYNIKVTAYLPGGTRTEFTYKRKVYSNTEVKDYSPNFDRAVEALCEMEQRGMLPTQVAEGIYKILISDKPPVVKASGFKNSAYRIAAHVFPEKMTLYFDNRMYRQ